MFVTGHIVSASVCVCARPRFTTAAMNYQTAGDPMALNQAFFALNGHCGYNLKPQYMVNGTFAGSCSV